MPIVRLAKPDDSDTIVDILRAGFGESLLGYTIYSTYGMTDFVQGQIASHDLGVSRYFVSEEAEEIVGFAEFRLLSKEIFLNNIYVAMHSRGTGSGMALLNAGLILAQKRGFNKIGLDVLSNNSKAIIWYEKLGFEVRDEFVWLEMEIKSDSNCQNFTILNLPFAYCIYRNFGFASLDIETTSGSYSVGLLGEQLFRVNTFSILDDKEALACLTMLDPSRKLLCIDNVLNLPEIEMNLFIKVASSFRMSANIMTVLSHME